MEENQFDLGEALGSYEQAQADRNFYLSMVQQGQQNRGAFMASPIAAYLAGVAGVKMANQRAKVQDIQDARQAKLDATAAAEKAQKRADSVQGQIFNIMKGARDGSIAPGAAAAMLGPLTKELGYTLKQYDADNNQAIYNIPGDSQDYVFDLGESPTSKLQQSYYKTQSNLELQRAREDRLAREAESRIKLNQEKLNALAKGKASANSTAAETKFLQENKDLFDNVFNPKSVMLKRQPLEQRLANYVGKDTSKLNKWIRGVATLPEDAQERLGEYTDLIALQLDTSINPQGATLVSPGEKASKTKAF